MPPKKNYGKQPWQDRRDNSSTSMSRADKEELEERRKKDKKRDEEDSKKRDKRRRVKDRNSLMKVIRETLGTKGKSKKKDDSSSPSSSTLSSDDSDDSGDSDKSSSKSMVRKLEKLHKSSKKDRRSIEKTVGLMHEELKAVQDTMKRVQQSEKDRKEHARNLRRQSLESGNSSLDQLRTRSLSPVRKSPVRKVKFAAGTGDSDSSGKKQTGAEKRSGKKVSLDLDKLIERQAAKFSKDFSGADGTK